MSTFEELEQKPREERTALEQCIVDAARLEDMRDGDTTLMEKAVEELNKLSVTICAYCGWASPKNDIKTVVTHIMECEKRPEKKLLQKALEVEDRLFQHIIHLTQSIYIPDECDVCKEISESIRVYSEGSDEA